MSTKRRLQYVALTEEGRKYNCEGNYIEDAAINLALRHPELLGQWVEIGGSPVKITTDYSSI